MGEALGIDDYLKSISFAPIFWLPKAEFSKRFGVSIRAIDGKINSGKWKVGGVIMRDPDGKTHISVVAYQKWVESEWKKVEGNEEALRQDAANLDYSSTGTTQSKALPNRTAGPSRHIKKKLKVIGKN